jgi:hypothetical protein
VRHEEAPTMVGEAAIPQHLEVSQEATDRLETVRLSDQPGAPLIGVSIGALHDARF